MEKKEFSLTINIYGRSTQKERWDRLIDVIDDCCGCMENLQINIFSLIPVTRTERYIVEQNLIPGWGEAWLKKNQADLTVIDDLARNELRKLTDLLKKDQPILVEKRFFFRYQNFFQPFKEVITYSHLNPIHLRLFLQKYIVAKHNRWPMRDRDELQKMVTEPDERLEDLERENTAVDEEENQAEAPVLWTKRLKIPGGGSKFSRIFHTDPIQESKKMPLVDLVVVNYNTLEYVKGCIKSIQKHTYCPYRLIVVDNGSQDGSIDYLRRLNKITLIVNNENLGYAAACNQGIMAGDSEFVVLLNADVQVSKGWLLTLVQAARKDARVGVVGPKMVNEQGKIVGAGVTNLNPFCHSRGWGEKNHPGLYDQMEECYSVGGACYLLRREVLEEVGAFDENYFFYYEESDLSLRMLERGYKVLYCPDTTVLHFHEGSLQSNNMQERWQRNQLFQKSQQRFLRKWETVLAGGTVRKESRAILMLGIIPWDFRYQRPQQIASRLAKQGYQILYVSNLCQPGGKIKPITQGIYQLELDGSGLVYQNLDRLDKKNRLIHSLYQAMEELEIDSPLIWVDAPYWEPIVPFLDRKMVIYDCMDWYSHFSDLAQHCPRLEELETDLCRTADLIFTSSKPLEEKLANYANKVFRIPNGADLAHFASGKNMSPPPDLQNVPAPIIGYYGAIAEWLDIELLAQAAKKYPRYSFVFIGRKTVDVGKLSQLANTFFLGEKPYQELPGYLEQFQVALIPFKKNQLTRATNPVKMYEYLAAGKPVISVDLPEIQEFRDQIYLANDTQEFIFLLDQVGKHEFFWEKRQRQKSIRGHDWQDRVEEISRILQEKEQELVQKSLFHQMKNGKMTGGEQEWKM